MSDYIGNCSVDSIVTNEIFGIKVAAISYDDLLRYIRESIENNKKRIISYVTANSLNIIYKKNDIKEIFNKFDLVHPDGIGTYLAIRFLHVKEKSNKKITGSDFYPILINAAKKFKWKIFFLGDRLTILEKIQVNNSGLEVCGYSEGYDFNSENLVRSINLSKADILIVGMGCPLQEKWIISVKDELNIKTILAVGDGIKLFANMRSRGAGIFGKIGLEWFIRLLQEPKRLWKRYLLGIPLFCLRIIRQRIFN